MLGTVAVVALLVASIGWQQSAAHSNELSQDIAQLTAGSARQLDATNARLQDLEGRLEQMSSDQAAEASAVDVLGERLDGLPDPAWVAADTQPSVVVVEAGDSLGSAFVIESKPQSSVAVTNFHVIEQTWVTGGREVTALINDGRFTARVTTPFQPTTSLWSRSTPSSRR